MLIDKAKELTGTAEEQKALKDAEKEEHITVKDLEEIETALEEIAEHKQLNIEKEELKDLKEEISEYKEVRVVNVIRYHKSENKFFERIQ